MIELIFQQDFHYINPIFEAKIYVINIKLSHYGDFEGRYNIRSKDTSSTITKAFY